VLGFDNAPVALIVLLFYMYPLLVAVGAATFFDERPTRLGIAFIVIGTAGLALAIGTPSSVTAVGVLCGLGAGIGNAIVVLGIRVLLSRGLRVLEVAALSYAIPATVASALLISELIPVPPSSGGAWLYALAYATTGTLVPWTLFYSAMRVIGASLAALLATAEPLISVVLAYLILGERLGPWQIAGGALIVIAIIGLAARTASIARAHV
jgi:drug/metabolite transporter (DMT)-like permease